jgi:hypothetical protein
MMTTMNGSLPVVGAALDIASLPQYVDWLVDKQRDLEIQDRAQRVCWMGTSVQRVRRASC